MKYLKKQLDAEAIDAVRINLSTQGEKLGPEPVCDWCGDNTPVVVYAAKQMANGTVANCWRWMACARCERMIENGNWDALQRKATARFKALFKSKLEAEFKGRPVPDSLVNEAVQASLNEFHKHAVVLGEP